MCIQPLKGMIQASPQIQDEGPLEHFGGAPQYTFTGASKNTNREHNIH